MSRHLKLLFTLADNKRMTSPTSVSLSKNHPLTKTHWFYAAVIPILLTGIITSAITGSMFYMSILILNFALLVFTRWELIQEIIAHAKSTQSAPPLGHLDVSRFDLTVEAVFISTVAISVVLDFLSLI